MVIGSNVDTSHLVTAEAILSHQSTEQVLLIGDRWQIFVVFTVC